MIPAASAASTIASSAPFSFSQVRYDARRSCRRSLQIKRSLMITTALQNVFKCQCGTSALPNFNQRRPARCCIATKPSEEPCLQIGHWHAEPLALAVRSRNPVSKQHKTFI